MKELGIFGGTFDPIHIGHLYIAEKSIELLNLEKLIIVPSGNPPHKTGKVVTEGHLRSELIKIAIEDNEKYELSEVEVNKSSYSYTYETLNYFKEKWGEDYRLNFITGTDCLMDLSKWKNFEEILRLCRFVVFNRNGFSEEDVLREKEKFERELKANILFLDIKPMKISSSEIRESIKNNVDCKNVLPKGVYEKIMSLCLYSLK